MYLPSNLQNKPYLGHQIPKSQPIIPINNSYSSFIQTNSAISLKQSPINKVAHLQQNHGVEFSQQLPPPNYLQPNPFAPPRQNEVKYQFQWHT